MQNKPVIERFVRQNCGIRRIGLVLIFALLPALAAAVEAVRTIPRAEECIDVARLNTVSEAERAVLRMEWRAGLARAEESRLLNEMYERIERLQGTTNDIRVLMNALPSATKKAATVNTPSGLGPSALIPPVIAVPNNPSTTSAPIVQTPPVDIASVPASAAASLRPIATMQTNPVPAVHVVQKLKAPVAAVEEDKPLSAFKAISAVELIGVSLVGLALVVLWWLHRRVVAETTPHPNQARVQTWPDTAVDAVPLDPPYSIPVNEPPTPGLATADNVATSSLQAGISAETEQTKTVIFFERDAAAVALPADIPPVISPPVAAPPLVEPALVIAAAFDPPVTIPPTAVADPLPAVPPTPISMPPAVAIPAPQNGKAVAVDSVMEYVPTTPVATRINVAPAAVLKPVADGPAQSEESIIELAEMMLSMGLATGAAQKLVDHIRANPKKALAHWLKLLDIYRENGQRSNFEQAAKQLQKEFNIRASDWMRGTADRPRLEKFDRVFSKIEELWSQPAECIAFLSAMLADNRDGQRIGFPQEVAEEILLLIEIQRETSGLTEGSVAAA